MKESIKKEQNKTLKDIYTIIAKIRKDIVKKKQQVKQSKSNSDSFVDYDMQNIEKSNSIIKKFFSSEKGKFIVRNNVTKTLFEWYKQSDNYYKDFYYIAKGLTNLLNNQLANDTDTLINGCDKAHDGYRHFHTNGQTKCDYSVVYYKNKKSGNIHLVAIDNHKDLKMKKNKYPNISTLE